MILIVDDGKAKIISSLFVKYFHSNEINFFYWMVAGIYFKPRRGDRMPGILDNDLKQKGFK
jgi:hypothetical protein